MTPFVSDPDFELHVGDVREVLASLPAGSVDCCVTSPPYWGLRDYGTGSWAGGDPDCDHMQKVGGTGASTLGAASGGNDMSDAARERATTRSYVAYAGVCGKCGAARTDSQIGLEATPELFVAEIVSVFREVRRVLADHGTLWLNLGDSYVAGASGNSAPFRNGKAYNGNSRGISVDALKPKDLVGIPWRVAFALQADGWYLRSDIIWAKPNPMPESVTDRPTKSHEYVFLLSKQPRYFFDQEAVREPHSPDGRMKVIHDHAVNGSHENYANMGTAQERWPNGGRNIRSVWEIATQPYPEAHFATFPEALPERCIKAGCPERVCGTCGKASERIVERGELVAGPSARNHKNAYTWSRPDARTELDASDMSTARALGGHIPGHAYENETTGWSDCGHDNWRTGTVLDPFMGSGTTALVARRLGRKSIGVELNPEYAQLCARRLQQLSLLAEGAA